MCLGPYQGYITVSTVVRLGVTCTSTMATTPGESGGMNYDSAWISLPYFIYVISANSLFHEASGYLWSWSANWSSQLQAVSWNVQLRTWLWACENCSRKRFFSLTKSCLSSLYQLLCFREVTDQSFSIVYVLHVCENKVVRLAMPNQWESGHTRRDMMLTHASCRSWWYCRLQSSNKRPKVHWAWDNVSWRNWWCSVLVQSSKG